MQKVYVHRLVRLPETAKVSQQDAANSYLLSFKHEITNQKFTGKWLKVHSTIFVLHRCLFSGVRWRRRYLPTDKQKLGASILVSWYFGTEKLPTQPTELRKAESYVPLQTCWTVAWDWTRFLPSFFPTSSPNSCSIRLGCCSQLLQTVANTVAIILQIPLLTTGLRGWFLNIICFPQRMRERYWQEVRSRTAVPCTFTDSIASIHISNEFIF